MSRNKIIKEIENYNNKIPENAVTIPYLVEHMNLSRATIIKRLQKLEEQGKLTRDKNRSPHLWYLAE